MAKVVTNYKGDSLFETQLGRHTLLTDGPAAWGGKDRAPMPPDVFVTSLATCIGVLVAHYCEENGIDDSDMSVEITYEKAEEPTRLVDLAATVKLPHGDCQKRVRAIERVADFCPVHATIKTMRGMEIEVLGEGQCSLEPEE